MSEGAAAIPARRGSDLFSAKAILWVVAAGVIGFALFILLATYAPDYRPASQMAVPANVHSKGGNGFAGLDRWLKAHDYETDTVRDTNQLYNENLVIVTLEADVDEERLRQIVIARSGQPTLYILPKYYVKKKKEVDGWVEKVDRLPVYVSQRLVDNIANTLGVDPPKIAEASGPSGTLAIEVEEVIPVKASLRNVKGGAGYVHDKDGNAVLASLGTKEAYILVDPDLMNNAGLADPAIAHAAIDTIDAISPTDFIVFDLTAHVTGKNKYSLLKLMLEPPFLALTLTIVFASLLAVLNGLGRFGPPRVPSRVFAFGKRSLVDMTALMMRRGGKLGGLAPGYAALVRQRAGEALGAPPHLSAEALDNWLEDTDRTQDGDWRDLVAEASVASGPQSVKSIAKKLYDWKARRISER